MNERCPTCKRTVHDSLELGALLACRQCKSVCRFTEAGLQLLTPGEVSELPEATRLALDSRT